MTVGDSIRSNHLSKHTVRGRLGQHRSELRHVVHAATTVSIVIDMVRIPAASCASKIFCVRPLPVA